MSNEGKSLPTIVWAAYWNGEAKIPVYYTGVGFDGQMEECRISTNKDDAIVLRTFEHIQKAMELMTLQGYTTINTLSEI